MSRPTIALAAMLLLGGCGDESAIAFYGALGFGVGINGDGAGGGNEVDSLGSSQFKYGNSFYELELESWHGSRFGPANGYAYARTSGGEIGPEGQFRLFSQGCTWTPLAVQCGHLIGTSYTWPLSTEPVDWELGRYQVPGQERVHTFDEEPRWD